MKATRPPGRPARRGSLAAMRRCTKLQYATPSRAGETSKKLVMSVAWLPAAWLPASRIDGRAAHSAAQAGRTAGGTGSTSATSAVQGGQRGGRSNPWPGPTRVETKVNFTPCGRRPACFRLDQHWSGSFACSSNGPVLQVYNALSGDFGSDPGSTEQHIAPTALKKWSVLKTTKRQCPPQ